MMRWIVGQSLRARFLVVAIAAGVMFFGSWQLREAPVDVFPEFESPRVEIQTEALGLSAVEVEELITLNLEELLSSTAQVEEIRSKSLPGLSSIELIFERGTDPNIARQLVAERLSSTYTLPNVSKPPSMIQPLSATGRVMMIGLSSEELSLIEMSVVARWTITPKLLGVPGVANVAIWGQRGRQLQVNIDPDRLRAHGVSQDQVISTTGNALWVSPIGFLQASVPGTGGWIEAPNQRLGIRHNLPISSPDDLAQVSIDGTSLRLGDIAEVIEGHPPLIGDALLSDGPGLLVVVGKFPGTNTLDVTRDVEAALDELRPGLSGIEIDTSIFRTATFIETAFDNLATALLIGALLVILVLGAYLFDWRVALISVVAIPLSLVAAGLVLYLLGATINLIVLAGFVIAIGAVVDDAIINIENIVRRLRQHRKEGSDKSAAEIILDASLEISAAIVFATLILALAVMPVFLLGGLSGAFLEPLVFSYTLALLASMMVTLTVTPALSLILLSRAPLERRESPLVRWLQRGYEGILSRIIHRPSPALVAAAVIVVGGLAASALLGQSLLDRDVTVPSFQETDLLIEVDSAPGTSNPEMVRILTLVRGELQSIPGVENVAATIGRAVTGDQVVGTNSSQLWVSIDPKADYDGMVAAIEQTVDGYPGLDGDLQPYLRGRIGEVLAGADEPITVRVFGPGLEVLSRTAEEVRQVLSGIDGLVDLQVEGLIMEPHVEVEVDLAKAQSSGLTPGDIRRAAATMFGGILVGNLFEEQKVFDVVVWSTPETRNSLTDLREVQIDTPSGGHVRLGDVAKVQVVPNPTVINHVAIAPYIDVVANVSGRDRGAVVGDVERRLQEVDFPLEYRTSLLGDYVERQATQRRLLGFTVAAAIGIFLLLQASFRSWRLASLAFFTLPAALVGGVLAGWLAGGGITSLASLAGLLAVFGIAARNGIVLLNHYQHLEQHEGESFGPGLVLRGARERFAPILMTATTTVLALLPLVVLGDIAGLEIVHPMAVVILGGLVTSTLLNLFVIPAMYLRFAPSPPTVSGRKLMLRDNRWVIVPLIIAGLILSACGGTSDTSGKSEPAEVERIEGNDIGRVILSARAAERLDIQTAPVRVEEVVRTWMVGAEVVAVPIGGRTPPTEAPSAVWVRVALSEGELNRIDLGKPARVLPIAGDDGGPGATAQAVEGPAADDPEGASGALYYAVDGADHSLVPGQRVRVELVLSGSLLTIIPYASLIYDVNGDTWTYTSPEPLVFLRHRVTVDYIDADLVFLSDGPPAGVAVVTIGAAELFGVELGIE